MNNIKLMIVEDAESDLEVCRTSIYVYEKKKCEEGVHLKIELVICEQVDDALDQIDGSFDGVIVDLKFTDGDDRGKDVLNIINNYFLRIPVIVLTGTPDSISDDEKRCLVGVLKKGEADYQNDILGVFFEIYNTGLTKIMGGRGIIEKTLSQVYTMNLLPQLENWKSYGISDPERTEKAILRFAISHLMQILDNDGDEYFHEEAYIYPPMTNGIRSGSIVKKKSDDELHIVLSPACDLVIRNDQFSTERILLVKIEDENKVYKPILSNKKSDIEEKEASIIALLNNRRDLKYHYLPETLFFLGGYINFRKVSTYSKSKCVDCFDEPHIQISPQFIKDIVSRFSSFYARQGQPVIDHQNKTKKVRELISTTK